MGVSSSHRLRKLFDRYLRRDLTPAEVEELVSLLGQAEAEAALSEPMARISPNPAMRVSNRPNGIEPRR